MLKTNIKSQFREFQPDLETNCLNKYSHLIFVAVEHKYAVRISCFKLKCHENQLKHK